MLSKSDKTADHEMSTSDHGPFHCVRFASVRSITAALSGESGAAIWHGSDRHRKGFDPAFCKTSGCYTAKVRARISHETQALACVTGAFSPLLLTSPGTSRTWGGGLPHSHLSQNRDPIADLGNRHGGPIRYETDFNAHIDPLIFIVPVGLDGVDIDRELPRRVLHAYDLRSY